MKTQLVEDHIMVGTNFLWYAGPGGSFVLYTLNVDNCDNTR